MVKLSEREIAVIGAFVLGALWLTGAFGTAAVTGQTGTGATGTLACDPQVSTTFSFNQRDVDKVGTSIAGNTDYWQNGIRQAAQTSAPDDVTVSPGDILDIYSYHPGTHYGKYVTGFEVPCRTTAADEARLAKNGTVAVTVVNDDGLTANSASALNSIGTDETTTVTIKIKENAADSYWGNPNVGYYLISFGYDTANYTELEIIGGEKISTPLMHAGDYQVSYKVPGTLSQFQEDVLTLKIDPVEGVNPTGNVTYAIADSNYFAHSLSGDVLSGVETNAGVDVGSVDVTGTIYIS